MDPANDRNDSNSRGQIQKKSIWDPEPELTITSPYVDSRVDSNTCAMGISMPQSTLTLYQRLFYLPVRDLGFGLMKRRRL
jgi:hypothetical protein